MKTAITPVRAFAVALAAPMLLAAPAAAQTVERTITRIETPLPGVSIQLSSSYNARDDFRGPSWNGLNEWRQSEREVRALRRDAIQACRAAVRQEGRRLGYRKVDIDDDLRVRQLGPTSSQVRFDEVEFEHRRRDVERRVTCETQRGRVTGLSGLPRPVSAGPPGRRW